MGRFVSPKYLDLSGMRQRVTRMPCCWHNPSHDDRTPGQAQESTRSLLRPGARIFVAGHRGLVGSALVRRLTADGHEVITRGRDELDLREGAPTEAFLRETRPDAVVLAAARVGGIMANSTSPVQFLEDNLRIQLAVVAGAHAAGVPRLLLLGSSCIYPKHAPSRSPRAPCSPARSNRPTRRTRWPRSPESSRSSPTAGSTAPRTSAPCPPISTAPGTTSTWRPRTCCPP